MGLRVLLFRNSLMARFLPPLLPLLGTLDVDLIATTGAGTTESPGLDVGRVEFSPFLPTAELLDVLSAVVRAAAEPRLHDDMAALPPLADVAGHLITASVS